MAFYSATFYSQMRRQRVRQQLQGFYGPIEDVIAAETAASESRMSPTAQAIMIGVATGAITLVVNRIIERVLFGK